MALGTAAKSIVEGLFGDVVPSVRQATRGYTEVDDELIPSRLVKPEIMTGEVGTTRVMEMPEFQGVKQAQRQENLDIAYKMLEEGADNRDIAARTGFGFYDGKPIMEIDDNQAELAQPLTNIDPKKTYKASEIIKHEDFYKVYPEMKDIKIKFYDGDPPEVSVDNGYFDLDTKTIGLNKNSWIMSNQRSGAMNFEEIDDDIFALLMQTVLHETQHAVQQLEKLPGGGSPSDFMKGGKSGLNLSREDAQKRYSKIIGELWARNVGERFGQPKTKSPFETLGKDEESQRYEIDPRKAILESGEVVNPFYNEPVERTIR